MAQPAIKMTVMRLRLRSGVRDEVMKETYKPRNRVERAFGKAKQFRRFATRYEKLGEMFLGLVRLVFGFIHIKKTALSVNRP